MNPPVLEKHYLLFYKAVDNYVERRKPYRADHIDLITAYHKAGDFVMGGAYDSPADGAALIFKSEASARAFAEKDPYVKNGLVTEWFIREWNVVKLD